MPGARTGYGGTRIAAENGPCSEKLLSNDDGAARIGPDPHDDFNHLQPDTAALRTRVPQAPALHGLREHVAERGAVEAQQAAPHRLRRGGICEQRQQMSSCGSGP